MRLHAAIPVLVLALASAAMFRLPSPVTLTRDDGPSCRARVVGVDDSLLTLVGQLEYGTEQLEVELLDGPMRGRRFRAQNELRAQLELDKKFAPGDIAVVTAPDVASGRGEMLRARDHARWGWLAVLFAAFSVMLVWFGGWTGAKALFSFLFSCLAIWKILIPLCLRGYSASWVTLVTVSVLTAAIMYLVAGFTRKGIAAFLGAMLGIISSLGSAEFFTRVLHVNGATMPFVQTLLYSGYEHLDLAGIFVGSVILSSSGAVMDLAMDIASATSEVSRHNPELSRRELFRSGMRVARSVVGTMTTTLLLAYSGGYLTLLMVFAAEGTSPADFINSTLVSAEIVKTLVGSFGLVLVAPFTAIASAFLERRFATGSLLFP